MAVTVDLGMVEISHASYGLVHAVQYEAHVRSLSTDAQCAVATDPPPLDCETLWIPPGSQFTIDIIFSVPVDVTNLGQFDTAMPHLCTCLESASLWKQLGYECSTSLHAPGAADGRHYIRMFLTRQPLAPLTSGRRTQRASSRIYGDATASDVVPPSFVSTYHLEVVTLNVEITGSLSGGQQPVATPAVTQLFDKCFDVKSMSMVDDNCYDDDLLFMSNVASADIVSSVSTWSVGHLIEVIDAALRVSITSRRASFGFLKIKKSESFRRLVDLAPAIWKPDGLLALALHAAFVPTLRRTLSEIGTHDDHSTIDAPRAERNELGLWCMLHRKLLEGALGPKLAPIVLPSTTQAQASLNEQKDDLFAGNGDSDGDLDGALDCPLADEDDNNTSDDLFDAGEKSPASGPAYDSLLSG